MPTTPNNTSLHTSSPSILFGLAVGDALGLATEFMSKDEVQTHYPDGISDYSQIIRDKHRSRWSPGSWTDDTDQALCIINAVRNHRQLTAVTFAQELRKWFDKNPMGIGQTVYKVITAPQFTEKPHSAAKLIWKMSGRKSAANGAIMRTAAVACWQSDDESAVRSNAETICKVTHYDPRCVGSSVIITMIVRSLITSGEPLSLHQLIQLGEDYDPRIREYIVLAYNNSISSLNLDDKQTMGYTLKTMAAGLWAYFHATSYEHGISTIIRQGGDADTNAAVAGSILGAKFGLNNIPSNWLNGLQNKHILTNAIT
jgi:ADP-ribosylglycohydrolase